MTKKYMPQVATEHYTSESYDSEDRFTSYYMQKQLVLDSIKNIKRPKVLEIGKGSGFLCEYLKLQGVEVKTFDFDESLKPDYVGDIRELDKSVSENFDTVTCFEVLEHIPYEDLSNTLRQIAEVTTNTCIVSVPQMRLYVSFWLKLPVMKPISLYLSTPFAKKHAFDGQHYWELGYQGYSERKVRSLFEQYFTIERDFTHPLMPYHHFFCLSKHA